MNTEDTYQKPAVLTNTMHDYASSDVAPTPTHRVKSSAPSARVRKHSSARFRRVDESRPEQQLPSVAMPKIQRISMVPTEIQRNPLRCFWQGGKRDLPADEPTEQGLKAAAIAASAWRRMALRRRLALALLIILQTVVATWSLSNTFPYPWLKSSEVAILGMFVILFSWISFGFWTAAAGFWMLWKRTKAFVVAELSVALDDAAPLRSRTAVLMPIANESVDRVFAGIEANYRSLAGTGDLSKFDFFILSDTADAERQVQEALAWADLCRSCQAEGKIFYRHRRNNIRRKSGNIADFLRRWGSSYDYMIVLDADSVMSGESMVRLARMMDRYPKAGIIQTSTTTVNCDSLFGRVQQFAGRAYGGVLTAGLRFWQLGESYYWGHNAIIRVAPFVKQCGLRRLPGKAPLGGEILSHDFVEAALMGRAGYEVWVVQDVPGSYEETPPTLADELKRDRRWCQGNLQHMRLLLADGLRFGHRAIFFTGIMSYVSGLLWLLFLILNTVEIAAQAYLPVIYFSSEPSLFPIWPQWHPEWAIALLTTTAVLLFLPKLLSLLIIVRNRETHLFGGFIALSASILLEMTVSTLLAPIRMWFHSKFVIVTLMGRQIKWGPQFRTDNETRWRDAIRLHGVATLVAIGWMTGMLWVNPAASVWLVPVVLSLIVSIPLSVLSSRVSLGRTLRRWRLFLIPEEVSPPRIIRDLQGAIEDRQRKAKTDAFVCAAVHAYANNLHLKLTRCRGPKSPEARKQNQSLVQDALDAGPAILSAADKARLLRDAASMAFLHRSIWRIRDPNIAGQWGIGDLQ